jgi:hypothetical protein
MSALACVFVVVIAACGDDATTATTTIVASSSTTAAAATTAAPATSAAPATTEPAVNPSVEAAVAIEGTYVGEWNNDTFGSSGPIELTIEVDEGAESATITLDLGGSVFGASDPDPIEYAVDLSGAPDAFDVSDDLFGESSAEMDADGHFVLEAPAVPGLGGISMTIEGDLSEDGFVGTYVIPGLAEGTFEAIPSN